VVLHLSMRPRSSKKDKEQKKRDSLESTGSQLCLEAEQRAVKHQRSVSSVTAKKVDPDTVAQDLLEFEKKKHSDDHTYRMERLEFEKEEQKLRLAQMAENTKRNDQLERSLLEMGKLIQVVADKAK
ncbi:hypothetical protein DYB26_004589, partial [Aphanomyces astaci]